MAAILENGRLYYRYVFLNGFTVILDPENIYLHTKIMIVGESEAEILKKHVLWRPYWKMAAILVRGQIWNGPIAKNFRYDLFFHRTKFHACIIN